MDPVTAMLIMGGLNAGMGAMKAQQAAKQRQSEANLRAAEIEASPWTNKQASTQIQTASPNVWADMLGGAVSGIGQAQAFQNAGLFNTNKVADATSMGSLDPNLMVGGQKTAFGTIGGEGLDDTSRQGVDFFNAPPPNSSTWNRMLAGRPTIYGRY